MYASGNTSGSSRLPNELYHYILTELQLMSPSTLLITALVNRTFVTLSKAHIWRRVHVNITGNGQDSSKRLLKRLLASETLSYHVREIQVAGVLPGRRRGDYAAGDILSLLVEIVGATPARLCLLEQFFYNTPHKMPAALLNALTHCFPTCRLSMRNFPGYILPVIPSLYELRASLSEGNSDPQTGPVVLTQRTVLNSPNLRSLRICLKSQGCVVRPRLTEFPTETLRKEERYAPLEDLRVKGYRFTDRGIEGWMKAMDWTRLHTLEIGEYCASLPFIQAMAPARLPALASLRLVLPYFENSGQEELYLFAVKTFLMGASEHGLENLALQGEGYQKIYRDAIERHATTLKTLSLHDMERVEGDQREMLTFEDLMWLNVACENLEDLSIDINPKVFPDKVQSTSSPKTPWFRREPFPDLSACTDVNSPPEPINASWPQDFLAILISPTHFRRLCSLTLFSPMGIANCTSLVSPTAFRSILFLLAHSSKLREGGFVVGETYRTGLLGGRIPNSWISWEQHHTQHWVVRKEGYDGKVVVKRTRCSWKASEHERR